MTQFAQATTDSVLDIPAAEVEAAPTFGAGIRGDFIRGMGKVNGKFVILLDVDHALAMEEMAVRAPALSETTERAA